MSLGTPEETRAVERLFRKYDTDHSGTIAAEELEGILNELLFDQKGGGTGVNAADVQAMAREELAKVDLSETRPVAESMRPLPVSTSPVAESTRGELDFEELLRL
jgi:hypothetical protein